MALPPSEHEGLDSPILEEASPQSLGFALAFEGGAALLRLLDREVMPGIILRALDLEIPDVRFPLDVTGGADWFQNRRLNLRAIHLEFDLKHLFQAYAAVLDSKGIKLINLRIESGVAVIEGEVGDNSVPFVAHAILGATTDLLARLQFFDCVVLKPSSIAPPCLLAALTEAIPERRKSVPGARILHISDLFVQPLLTSFGWKQAATSEMDIDWIDVVDERFHLLAATPGKPSWYPARPSYPASMARARGARAMVADELVTPLYNAILSGEDNLATAHQARQLVDRYPDDDDVIALAVEALSLDEKGRDEAVELIEAAQPRQDLRLLAAAVRTSSGPNQRCASLELLRRQTMASGLYTAARCAAVEEGRQWLTLEEPVRALHVFSQALELASTNLDALRGAFTACRLSGQLIRAIRHGEKALRISGPPLPDLAVEVAEIHLQLDDLERARRAYRRALRSGPRADALLGLASVAEQKSDPVRVVSLLSQACQTAREIGDGKSLRRGLARRGNYQLSVLEDPAGALRSVDELLELGEDRTSILILGGRAAAELNDKLRARELYKKACDGAQEESELAYVNYQLAMLLLADDEESAAEGYLQKASELSEKIVRTDDFASEFDVGMAARETLLGLRAKRGDVEARAELCLLEANRAKDPQSRAVALLGSAHAYFEMGQVQAAVSGLLDAVETDIEVSGAEHAASMILAQCDYDNLGYMVRRSGQLPQASLRRHFLQEAAQRYVEIGDHEAADQAFASALQYQENTSVLLIWADHIRQRGDAETLTSVLGRIADADAGQAGLSALLENAQIFAGPLQSPDKAVAHLQQALLRDAPSSVALDLADAQLKAKDHEGAYGTLERLLKDDSVELALQAARRLSALYTQGGLLDRALAAARVAEQHGDTGDEKFVDDLLQRGDHLDELIDRLAQRADTLPRLRAAELAHLREDPKRAFDVLRQTAVAIPEAQQQVAQKLLSLLEDAEPELFDEALLFAQSLAIGDELQQEIKCRRVDLLEGLGDTSSAAAVRAELLAAGVADPVLLRAQRDYNLEVQEQGLALDMARQLSDWYEAAPGDAVSLEAHLLAAELAVEQEQDAQAARYYERLFTSALEVENEIPVRLLPSLQALADVYERLSEYEALCHTLERAVLLCHSSEQSIALFKRIAAVEEHRLARPENAARALERVLRADSSDSEAATALSKLYEFLGDTKALVELHHERAAMAETTAEKAALLIAAGDAQADSQPLQAIKTYHRALDVAPESNAAFEHLSQLARRLGSHSSLVRATLHMARLRSDKEAARLYEEAGAVLAGLMVRPRMAATVLMGSVAKAPYRATATRSLIEVARAAADPDFALAILKQLRSISGLHAEVRVDVELAYADLLLAEGAGREQVRPLYEDVLSYDNHNVRALDAMIAFTSQEEDPDSYLGYVSQRVSNLDIHTAKLLIDAAYKVASSRPGDAREYLLQAMQLGLEKQTTVSKALEVSRILQEHQMTVRLGEHLLDLEPVLFEEDHAALLREQAYLLADELGDPGAASSALERLIDIVADDHPARVRLAELLLVRGDIETGALHLDYVLQHVDSEKNQAVWRRAAELRARSAVETDDQLRAVEIFSQIVAVDPTARSEMLGLTRSLQSLNRNSEAAVVLLQAVELLEEPEDKAYTLMRAGGLQSQCGEEQAAFESYLRAALLCPNMTEAWQQAEIYSRQSGQSQHQLDVELEQRGLVIGDREQRLLRLVEHSLLDDESVGGQQAGEYCGRLLAMQPDLTIFQALLQTVQGSGDDLELQVLNGYADIAKERELHRVLLRRAELHRRAEAHAAEANDLQVALSLGFCGEPEEDLLVSALLSVGERAEAAETLMDFAELSLAARCASLCQQWWQLEPQVGDDLRLHMLTLWCRADQQAVDPRWQRALLLSRGEDLEQTIAQLQELLPLELDSGLRREVDELLARTAVGAGRFELACQVIERLIHAEEQDRSLRYWLAENQALAGQTLHAANTYAGLEPEAEAEGEDRSWLVQQTAELYEQVEQWQQACRFYLMAAQCTGDVEIWQGAQRTAQASADPQLVAQVDRQIEIASVQVGDRRARLLRLAQESLEEHQDEAALDYAKQLLELAPQSAIAASLLPIAQAIDQAWFEQRVLAVLIEDIQTDQGRRIEALYRRSKLHQAAGDHAAAAADMAALLAAGEQGEQLEDRYLQVLEYAGDRSQAAQSMLQFAQQSEDQVRRAQLYQRWYELDVEVEPTEKRAVLRSWAEADTTALAPRWTLAEMAVEQQHYAAALDLLEQLVDWDLGAEKQDRADRLLAVAAQALGHAAQARVALERIVERDPNDKQSRLDLIDALVAQECFLQAANLLQEMAEAGLEEDGSSESLIQDLVRAGQLYAQGNNLTKALECYLGAALRQPANKSFWQQLEQCARQYGDQQWLDRVDDELEQRGLEVGDRDERLVRLTQRAYASGQGSKGLAHGSLLLKRAPTEDLASRLLLLAESYEDPEFKALCLDVLVRVTAEERRMRSLLRRAELRQNDDQFIEAADDLRQVIDAGHGDDELQDRYVDLLLLADSQHQAAEFLLAASQREEKQERVAQLLARWRGLDIQIAPEVELPILTRWSEADPAAFEPLWARIQLCLQLQRQSDALVLLKHLEDWQLPDKERQEVDQHLADCAWENGDMAQVSVTLQRLLERSPEDLQLQSRLAKSMVALGRHGEAAQIKESMLRRQTQQDAENPQEFVSSLVEVADLYNQAEQSHKACECYLEAARLQPEVVETWNRVDQLAEGLEDAALQQEIDREIELRQLEVGDRTARLHRLLLLAIAQQDLPQVVELGQLLLQREYSEQNALLLLPLAEQAEHLPLLLRCLNLLAQSDQTEVRRNTLLKRSELRQEEGQLELASQDLRAFLDQAVEDPGAEDPSTEDQTAEDLVLQQDRYVDLLLQTEQKQQAAEYLEWLVHQQSDATPQRTALLARRLVELDVELSEKTLFSVWQRWVEADRSAFEPRWARIQLCLQLQRQSEAQALLTELEDWDLPAEQRQEVDQQLADCAWDNGDMVQASVTLQGLLERSPEDRQLKTRLAKCWVALGRQAEAAKTMESMLREDAAQQDGAENPQEFVSSLLEVADLYRQADQLHQACRCYLEAAQLQPEVLDTWSRVEQLARALRDEDVQREIDLELEHRQLEVGDRTARLHRLLERAIGEADLPQVMTLGQELLQRQYNEHNALLLLPLAEQAEHLPLRLRCLDLLVDSSDSEIRQQTLLKRSELRQQDGQLALASQDLRALLDQGDASSEHQDRYVDLLLELQERQQAAEYLAQLVQQPNAAQPRTAELARRLVELSSERDVELPEQTQLSIWRCWADADSSAFEPRWAQAVWQARQQRWVEVEQLLQPLWGEPRDNQGQVAELLADAAEHNGSFELSIQVLSFLVEQSPQDEALLYRLADVLAAAEQFQQAAELLEKLGGIHAETESGQNDLRRAADLWLRALVEQGDESCEHQDRYVGLLLELQERQQAAEYLAQLVQQPDTAQQRTAELARRLVELDVELPEQTQLNIWRCWADADSSAFEPRWAQAVWQAKQQQWVEVEQLLQPLWREPRENRGQVAELLADAAEHNASFELSIQVLSFLVEQSPQDEALLHRLADVLADAEQFQQAAELLEKLGRTHAETESGQNDLRRAAELWRDGCEEWPRALAVFELLRQQLPEDRGIRAATLEMLEACGRFAKLGHALVEAADRAQGLERREFLRRATQVFETDAKDPEAALAPLNQLLDESLENEDLRQWRLELLRQVGDREQLAIELSTELAIGEVQQQRQQVLELAQLALDGETDSGAAVVPLRNLLRQDPADGEALEFLRQLADNTTHRFELAESLEAAAAHGEQEVALALLQEAADLLEQLGVASRAFELRLQTCRMAPHNTPAVDAVVKQLIEQQRTEEASELLLASAPGRPEIQQQRALHLAAIYPVRQKGGGERLLSALVERCRVEESTARLQSQLCLAALLVGDHEVAESSLRELVELMEQGEPAPEWSEQIFKTIALGPLRRKLSAPAMRLADLTHFTGAKSYVYSMLEEKGEYKELLQRLLRFIDRNSGVHVLNRAIAIGTGPAEMPEEVYQLFEQRLALATTPQEKANWYLRRAELCLDDDESLVDLRRDLLAAIAQLPSDRRIFARARDLASASGDAQALAEVFEAHSEAVVDEAEIAALRLRAAQAAQLAEQKEQALPLYLRVMSGEVPELRLQAAQAVYPLATKYGDQVSAYAALEILLRESETFVATDALAAAALAADMGDYSRAQQHLEQMEQGQPEPALRLAALRLQHHLSTQLQDQPQVLATLQTLWQQDPTVGPVLQQAYSDRAQQLAQSNQLRQASELLLDAVDAGQLTDSSVLDAIDYAQQAQYPPVLVRALKTQARGMDGKERAQYLCRAALCLQGSDPGRRVLLAAAIAADETYLPAHRALAEDALLEPNRRLPHCLAAFALSGEKGLLLDCVVIAELAKDVVSTRDLKRALASTGMTTVTSSLREIERDARRLSAEGREQAALTRMVNVAVHDPQLGDSFAGELFVKGRYTDCAGFAERWRKMALPQGAALACLWTARLELERKWDYQAAAHWIDQARQRTPDIDLDSHLILALNASDGDAAAQVHFVERQASEASSEQQRAVALRQLITLYEGPLDDERAALAVRERLAAIDDSNVELVLELLERQRKMSLPQEACATATRAMEAFGRSPSAAQLKQILYLSQVLTDLTRDPQILRCAFAMAPRLEVNLPTARTLLKDSQFVQLRAFAADDTAQRSKLFAVLAKHGRSRGDSSAVVGCTELAFVTQPEAEQRARLEETYFGVGAFARLADSYEAELLGQSDNAARASLHFNLAGLYRDQLRRPEKARLHLRQAAKLSPDDALVLRSRMEVERIHGTPRGLAEALEDLARVQRKSEATALRIEASRALEDIDPKAAEQILWRLLDDDRDNPDAFSALGRLAENQGHMVEASEALVKAARLTQNPAESQKLWLRAARLAERQLQDDQLAFTAYLEAADSGDPLALASAERIARRLGDLESLENVLGRRAVATQNSEVHLQLLLERAQLLFQLERPSEARLVLDKPLQTIASRPDAALQAALLLEAHGSSHTATDVYSKLLQDHAEQLSEDDRHDLESRLTQLYAARGDLERASRWAHQVLRRQSSNEPALAVLEATARELGDGIRLVDLLQRRLLLDLSDGEQISIYQELGQTHAHLLGDDEAAIASVQQGLEKHPEAPELHRIFCELLARGKKHRLLSRALGAKAEAADSVEEKIASYMEQARVMEQELGVSLLALDPLQRAYQLESPLATAARAYFAALCQAGEVKQAAEVAEKLAEAYADDAEWPQWMVVRGTAAHLEEDDTAAIQIYQQVVRQRPDYPDSYLPLWDLIGAGLNRGIFATIAASGRRHITDPKVRTQVGIIEAELRIEASDEERALECLADVLEQAPGSVKAVKLYYELCLRFGRATELAEVLERHAAVAKTDRQKAQRLRELAFVVRDKLVDEARATRLLNEVHELNPDDVRTQVALADLRYRSHDFEGARRLLSQLPVDTEGVDPTDRAFRLAQCELSLGDLEGYEKSLQQTLESDPKHLEALTALAKRFAQTGRMEQSVQLVQQAREQGLSLEPEAELGWLRIEAQLQVDRQQLAAAVDIYWRIHELEPGDASVLSTLAELLAQLDRPEAASEALRRLAPLAAEASDQVAIYNRAAEALASVGDDAGALRVYSQAADVDGDHLETLQGVAHCALKTGDGSRFGETALHLLELYPDYRGDAEFHAGVAQTLRSRGADPAEVLAQFDLATQLAPTDRDLQMEALTAAQLANSPQATVRYQEALLETSESPVEIVERATHAGRIARDVLDDRRKAIGLLYSAHVANPTDHKLKRELADLYAQEPSMRREAIAAQRQLIADDPSLQSVYGTLQRLYTEVGETAAAAIVGEAGQIVRGETIAPAQRARAFVRRPLALDDVAPSGWPKAEHTMLRVLTPIAAAVLDSGELDTVIPTDLPYSEQQMVTSEMEAVDTILVGAQLQVSGHIGNGLAVRCATRTAYLGNDIFTAGPLAVRAALAQAAAQLRMGTHLAFASAEVPLEELLALVLNELSQNQEDFDDVAAAIYRPRLEQALTSERRVLAQNALTSVRLNLNNADIRGWQRAARQVTARVVLCATGSPVCAARLLLESSADEPLWSNEMERQALLKLGAFRDLMLYAAGEKLALLAVSE